MTDHVDTARTVATAPASGAAPGAGEEVPDWLAEERAAAAEAGEPVQTPSVSVSASPDAAFGSDAPSAADAAVGADVAAADAVASDSVSGGGPADSTPIGPAAGSDSVADGGSAEGAPVVAAGASNKPKASTADVEEAMKDVVDPELGINVVDLGLVYGTHVDDDNVVTIDMTLTSAACPLTDVIEDQTRQALTTGPGGGLVDDFRINWVWLPPWGPDKITDDGRDQLRALGFNV
jgi:metal-sulfur cluster biosynthetic enzyme